MTAMEVGHLPLALVRSGRVELWLEMKLPNPEARRIILTRQLAKAGGLFANGDYEAVVSAMEGFTGADLKRVVEDAKSLLAFDRANGADELQSDGYLLRAIEGVKLNKTRYAEAELGARQRLRAAPSSVFELMSQMPIAAGLSFNSGWSTSE
jgi:transitional endoplasmic reticulum ATPase